MTIDKVQLKALADQGSLPPVVATLLAEIERLDRESQNLSNQLGQCDRDRMAFRAERDQLKADNEALRKDAERYNWAICRVQCAEALSAVVICHDGYKEKINERVDAYMEAWPCPVAAMAKEVSHD